MKDILPIHEGSYSVTESAKLLRTTRSFVLSYIRRHRGNGGPWEEQKFAGKYYLTFFDLMELRVAKRFADLGATWRSIRKIARSASHKCDSERYPLSHYRFKNEAADIIENQPNFHHRLSAQSKADLPSIMEELFHPVIYNNTGHPETWIISLELNLDSETRIIIDPKLAFGSPVIETATIRTHTLYHRWIAENGDARGIAEDYQITEAQVKAAYLFEERLEASL